MLRCNVPLVTQNYFLQNGYVARRMNLLAPSHNREDLLRNLSNSNGLTSEHRFMLDRGRQAMGIPKGFEFLEHQGYSMSDPVASDPHRYGFHQHEMSVRGKTDV